jgi:carbon-monoxide dehydrogenase medium subunit
MPFVGHPQIRTRGTLGGSLAHADPAAELPAVMVALGARLTLRSARGQRTVAAEDFFIAALTTALAPDELLTEVALPSWPARTGSSVQEVAIRLGDFALGGVATALTLDAQGRVAGARVVCFGVGPRPLRAADAERSLVGGAPSAAALAEAGRLASAAVDPSDDIHASGAYRRRLAGVLTTRALAASLASAAARAA